MRKNSIDYEMWGEFLGKVAGKEGEGLLLSVRRNIEA
jgi:hypothetical protein